MTMTRVPSIEGIISDADRINALYAPLRPRDANPEHYDRKIKFWVKAVEEYGLHYKRASFTLKELQTKFCVNGKTPACLREVIDQIYRDGKIVPENAFADNLRASESWAAWSQVAAKKTIWKVGSFMPINFLKGPAQDELRYVNEEQLKGFTERLLNESSLINKLMNVESWRSKAMEITGISEPIDIEFLLGHMRSKKIIVLDKVGSEDVTLMSAAGTQPKISDVEKGKYDIIRTKEILETQLKGLVEKKVNAEEKARASIKQGLRSTAKHELRRKKLLEQRMEKLLTMVDNLSVLESQIEDAESDAVLISTYEAGKKALTGVLADDRLNADHVTETMLDIQELLDQHSDINAALSQPMDNLDPDLAELENELEDLLKEDEQQKENSVGQPGSTLSKEEEAEIIKSLETLELDGLDDFSNTTVSSQVNKMDKSGDV